MVRTVKLYQICSKLVWSHPQTNVFSIHHHFNCQSHDCYLLKFHEVSWVEEQQKARQPRLLATQNRFDAGARCWTPVIVHIMANSISECFMSVMSFVRCIRWPDTSQLGQGCVLIRELRSWTNMSHQHIVLMWHVMSKSVFLNSFFVIIAEQLFCWCSLHNTDVSPMNQKNTSLAQSKFVLFFFNLSLSLHLLSFVHGGTARAVAQWPKTEQRMRSGWWGQW